MKNLKAYLPIIKRILLAAGVGVFIYLCWQLGWQNLVDSLQKVGWWWLGLVGLALVLQMCHVMAWRQILVCLGHRPNPFVLLQLKFVADAVNMVAPSANLGGDMARAYLVKGEASLSAGISSVMVDKTLDNFNRMFFNIAGLVLTGFFIPIPDAWVWGCVALFTIVFAFNVSLVVIQVKGFSNSVKKLARYLPPLRRKLEEQESKLHTLADDLRTVYLKSHGHLAAASIWHLAGRVLGLVEIWFVLRLLHTPVDFISSYYIAAVANIINGAFFLVPGQWGVAEGAQVLLLQSLGYTAAAGMSLAVIRRIRRLFLMGVGLLFFWMRKKEQPDLAPSEKDASIKNSIEAPVQP
ncbi:MAG: flippase-like domain-containing protein [Bacteroidota bacterium]